MGYLSRRRNAEYMPDDEYAAVAHQVRMVEMFSLADLMFVNADTLASLQIIQSESHPNTQMQGSSMSKESLSVFGLFAKLARTAQGKQKLRRMFLRPSTDLSVIQERHRTISVLLRSEHTTSLDTMTKSLPMIRDMRSVVIHLQKGISDFKGSVKKGVWASLQGFIYGTLGLLDGIRGLSMKEHALLIPTRVCIVLSCLSFLWVSANMIISF